MKEELNGCAQTQGRQTKSKARLARFEELSDVDYQKRNETNEIFIPVAERPATTSSSSRTSARASATGC